MTVYCYECEVLVASTERPAHDGTSLKLCQPCAYRFDAEAALADEPLFEPLDEDDDTSCARCGEPRNAHDMLHPWAATR